MCNRSAILNQIGDTEAVSAYVRYSTRLIV